MKDTMHAVQKLLQDRNWQSLISLETLSMAIPEDAQKIQSVIFDGLEDGNTIDSENIKQSLADLLLDVLILCDILDLDPARLLAEKIQHLEEEYPAASELKEGFH